VQRILYEEKSYWEDVENLLGTSWEDIGNKKIQHPHPAPAEKKSGHLDACCLTSLPATKRFASLYSLPFLAKANGKQP
jgi:hypothetical protein